MQYKIVVMIAGKIALEMEGRYPLMMGEAVEAFKAAANRQGLRMPVTNYYQLERGRYEPVGPQTFHA